MHWQSDTLTTRLNLIRPPNQRWRERARRRREAWIERRNCYSTISATTAAHTAAAEDMNAAAALAEKSEAADTIAAENSSAAATRAEVAQATTTAGRMSSAAPATRAAAAASSEDLTAAEDFGIGTAVSVKAVATTSAAYENATKCGQEKEGPLQGHLFLIRGEIQFSVIRRNRQRKSVMERI